MDAEKQPGRWARIGHTLLHELREVLPPTIFFFVGFNLILLTTRLILADYLVQLTGFLIATMSALIVGKVVLVADLMPFLRRFDDAPLAKPILFKSVVYTFLVGVARLIEAFLHYVFGGGTVGHGGFIEEQLGHFSWHRFAAIQIWILALFLVYVTGSEVNKRFGEGRLFKAFLTHRPSELRAARQARSRLLVRLTRLAEAHSVDVLRDPSTAPHAELFDILGSMTQKGKGE
jgi:hypothetical protein